MESIMTKYRFILLGGLALVASLASTNIVRSEIAGSYYDPQRTSNVAEVCKHGGEIVTFSKDSVVFVENTCKIRKIQKWQNTTDMLDYYVTCAQNAKNRLIVQQLKDGLWIQWDRG